MVLLIVKIAKE